MNCIATKRSGHLCHFDHCISFIRFFPLLLSVIVLGIEGACYLYKHLVGNISHMRHVQCVKKKRERGDKIPYSSITLAVPNLHFGKFLKKCARLLVFLLPSRLYDHLLYFFLFLFYSHLVAA